MEKKNWKKKNSSLKWKLDKAIYEGIQINRLKLSDYLPYQCRSDGEILDGHKFLVHCEVKHQSFVPAGSLITPYHYLLLWYEDLN